MEKFILGGATATPNPQASQQTIGCVGGLAPFVNHPNPSKTSQKSASSDRQTPPDPRGHLFHRFGASFSKNLAGGVHRRGFWGHFSKNLAGGVHRRGFCVHRRGFLDHFSKNLAGQNIEKISLDRPPTPRQNSVKISILNRGYHVSLHKCGGLSLPQYKIKSGVVPGRVNTGFR